MIELSTEIVEISVCITMSAKDFERVMLGFDEAGFDLPEFTHARELEYDGMYGPHVWFTTDPDKEVLATKEVTDWIQGIPAQIATINERLELYAKVY